MTLHFLNDLANDAESKQKSIIMPYSLVRRVNQLGKLINRIPGLSFLILSLPGSSLRTHVESLSKPHNLKALPGKLDIKSKDTHLAFSIFMFTSGPDKHY